MQGYLESNENTVTAKVLCGGSDLQWSKARGGNEIDSKQYCTQADGQREYSVKFGTNNLEPKWNWYNFADWKFEIEVISENDSIIQVIGINEADTSWKSVMSRGQYQLFEYTWDFSPSAFEASDDAVDLETTIANHSAGGNDGGDGGDNEGGDGGSDGGDQIVLDLPDFAHSSESPYTHSYYFDQDGT